jgi:hypothetical protein
LRTGAREAHLRLVMADFRLSARQRRALDALCRRIAPSAYDGEAGARLDLAAAVEERLAAAAAGGKLWSAAEEPSSA